MLWSGFRRLLGRGGRLMGAVAAASLIAGDGAAQNLDLEELGALLVLPVITGSGGSSGATWITVTNVGGPVRLHINVLSGDPGDFWRAQDFDCPLTARETVLFVFEATGSGSSVSYECSGNVVGGSSLAARNGVMVVTIEDRG